MIFCRSAWHDYRFTWIAGDLLYAAVHKLANFIRQGKQGANNNNWRYWSDLIWKSGNNKYVRQRTDYAMAAA